MPNQILPESQAFSDALMMTRFTALWLKECALETQNKLLELQTVLMNDGQTKIMGMDAGDIESGLMHLSAVHGEVKRIHKLANDLGRKLGVKMPENPTYSPQYLELMAKHVDVKLSAPGRR